MATMARVRGDVEAAKLLCQGNYRRISRFSGCSYQHISRVLRGERSPSLKRAALIAGAAGVTLDALWRYIERQRKAIPGQLQTEGGLPEVRVTRSGREIPPWL